MSDADDFGANPFRTLNTKQFPDKKKQGGVQRKPAHQGNGKRVIAGSAPAQHAEVSDEDSELFLHAVSSVKPTKGAGSKKSGAAATGFSIEEHGALTSMADALGVDAQGKERGKAKGSASDGKQVSGAASAAPVTVVQGKGQTRPQGKQATRAQTAPSTPEEYFANAAMQDMDEEAAAFLTAMGSVSPLSSGGRDVAPAPEPGTPPPHDDTSLQDFLDGKLEFALSFTDEYLEGHVVGLDQMILNKLRAGGLSPEAHLDLHGLNAMQAFEALRGFFKGSWYKGLRTVLVVPGRGRNSPDGFGILREKLQSWLTQDPFKRVVLAFCTAQPHDGGAGSVYVLLRKYRKKGRIYWERMPADADLY